MKLTTLCYIEKNGKYLMLHRTKKKKDINKDMWIGVGGHFEEDESPDECLLREVREETGLQLLSYKLRGIVTFLSDKCEGEYMFLYTSEDFLGEVQTCDEGDLEWVDKCRINELNFWTGDEIFFHLLDTTKEAFSLKLKYCGIKLEEAVLNGEELELFDVLDENGNDTGLVRERNVIHELGTWHRTSHIWIIRKKENGFDVLLQKRSNTKDSFPGCYDISSAGHIHAGDNYLNSAIREVKEELGIDLNEKDLFFAGIHKGTAKSEFYGKTFINNEISAVYICKKKISEKQLILQKEEVESVEWFDYNECTELINNNTLKNCIFMDEWLNLKEYVTQC